MKSKSLIFILFTVSLALYSFRVDSLKEVIVHSSEDTVVLNSYLKLVSYYSTHNPDSAIFYGNKALRYADSIASLRYRLGILVQLPIAYSYKGNIDTAIAIWENALTTAKENNFLRMASNFANNLGISYSILGDYSQALNYYLEAKNFAQKLNFSQRLASVSQNIGVTYSNLGLYKKAADNFFAALKYYEKHRDFTSIGNVYTNLANVHASLNNQQKAQEYFFRALENYKKGGSDYKKSLAYLNLATFFASNGHLTEAKLYLDSGKTLAEKKNFKFLFPVIYKIQGEISLKEKNYSNAIKFFQKYLDQNKQIGSLRKQIAAHYYLADAFYQKRDFLHSIKHLDTVLSLSQKLSALDKQKDAYYLFYKNYKALGQHKKANSFLEKHKTLSDSIANIKIKSQLQALEVAYNIAKQKAENKILKQKNKYQKVLLQQSHLKLLFSIIIIISLILALLTIWLNRKRKIAELQRLRQEEKIKTQEELKKKLSLQLHNVIQSKISLIINELKHDSDVKEMENEIKELEDVRDQVREISHILALPNFTDETIAQALKSLAHQHTKNNFRVNVDITGSDDWESVPKDIQQSIYRIVQELILNSIKHAAADQVFIHLSKEKNTIELMYEDNGKGYNPQEIDPGYGFKNIIRPIIGKYKAVFNDNTKKGLGSQVFFQFKYNHK